MKKGPLKKEWKALTQKEFRYLQKNREKEDFFLNKKLKGYVPDTLREKLDLAFYKGFQLVFEKGTPVIEKTYSKEKKEDAHKIGEYALRLRPNRKNLRAFSRRSRLSNTKNLAISLGEGIATGLPGIGLPDIPLFIGVILKSVYEIALSYGFTYDSDKERLFILKLIETALLKGDELEAANAEIDRLIKTQNADSADPAGISSKELESAIRSTANRLSHELLYLKFLQGIPIAGVIGGLSDAVYLKKITAYASLKYYRRFLSAKDNNSEEENPDSSCPYSQKNDL